MRADTTLSDAPLTPLELAALRALRLRSGWSYATMAGRIRTVSGPTLHRVLNGRVQPHATTAYQLREWLRRHRVAR